MKILVDREIIEKLYNIIQYKKDIFPIVDILKNILDESKDISIVKVCSGCIYYSEWRAFNNNEVTKYCTYYPPTHNGYPKTHTSSFAETGIVCSKYVGLP